MSNMSENTSDLEKDSAAEAERGTSTLESPSLPSQNETNIGQSELEEIVEDESREKGEKERMFASENDEETGNTETAEAVGVNGDVPPPDSSNAAGKRQGAQATPGNESTEESPGAFPVPRRAFGQFPAWGRANPEAPQANQETPPQPRGVSRRVFSTQFRRSVSRSDNSRVPQASPITDAELVVYPDQVQTPQDLEREQRHDVKRRRYMCIAGIILIVVVLVVGVGVGFQVGNNSGNDSDKSEPSKDQSCADLRLEEDPNIPLQCVLCGDVSGISPELDARYETLKMFLNITIETNKTSCEPRNLALLWLANDTIVRNLTEIPPPEQTREPEKNFTCPRNHHQWTLQRYVLALLYYSLEGRGWPRQQNWLSSEIECEWEGVECSFGREKRVLQLDLEGQNASGTIPYEVGKLCDLRRLELGRNRIRGPLPSELLRQLTSLRRIGVAENMLTGNIPDVMVAEGLDIIHETFGNFTPEPVGKKEKEELLDFIDEELLGGRSPLYDLDFSRNLFFGSVPFGYRLLRHLREVRFDNNIFTGALFPHLPTPIPMLGDISFFSDLEVFSASNNSLEGSMPRNVGQLTRLEHLDISLNKLTGTLVTEIGLLEELKHLDISFNKLTGTLVTEIGQLEELTTLRIGGNKINGTVPTKLKKLERLIDLDLSSPLLEGQLPGELCHQTFLEPPIAVHCDSTLMNECECCCCRSDEQEETLLEGEEKERCNARPKQTGRPP